MNDPIKTAVIFGTRPEAIKLAPLIRRMADKPDRFQPITIVTAQHREMLDQVLELFSIKPDHDLSILRPRQTLAEITASAIAGLDSILSKEKPDFVVVQGDTTTTFVGALSAFYHKIPVAHVEAGLRTQDKTNPFPEEINRRMTSVIADAHFAPTEKACQNLLAEGIGRDRIWLTGNTVIDALKDVAGWNRKCDHPVLKRVAAEKLRMLFVTSHRRENQGEPQEEICRALIELVKTFRDILVVFPVHLSPAVRDTVLPRLQGSGSDCAAGSDRLSGNHPLHEEFVSGFDGFRRHSGRSAGARQTRSGPAHHNGKAGRHPGRNRPAGRDKCRPDRGRSFEPSLQSGVLSKDVACRKPLWGWPGLRADSPGSGASCRACRRPGAIYRYLEKILFGIRLFLIFQWTVFSRMIIIKIL